MSQKLDAQGKIVGPYERDDLRTVWSPEKKVKHHRRLKLRKLDYDLVWEITEMQVKVYVRALFPRQVGPRLSQLAKEQALGPDERTVTGESRSKGLNKDIEITYGANDEELDDDEDPTVSEGERHDIPSETLGLQVNVHPQQHQVLKAATSSSNIGVLQEHQAENFRVTSEQEQGQATSRQMIPNKLQRANERTLNSAPNEVVGLPAAPHMLPQDCTQPLAAASSSSNSRTDGKRREGRQDRKTTTHCNNN